MHGATVEELKLHVLYGKNRPFEILHGEPYEQNIWGRGQMRKNIDCEKERCDESKY